MILGISSALASGQTGAAWHIAVSRSARTDVLTEIEAVAALVDEAR